MMFECDQPRAWWTGESLDSWHKAILDEVVTLTHAQWSDWRGHSLVQGFLLSGPPGVGKTTLVKRAAYELAVRLDRTLEGYRGLQLGVIDGTEIARAKYGDSELRIRNIFASAQHTSDNGHVILLFDDADSVLLSRASPHAKEWHYALNSAFFRQVDELDTRRVAIFLTTNRPDMIDPAVRDRFLEYEFIHPSKDALVSVALKMASARSMPPKLVESLKDALEVSFSEGRLSSMREVRRVVLQVEIAELLGGETVASLEPRVES